MDDKIVLMFELPKWMHEALATRAKAVGMTVGQLLENIVANWCGHTVSDGEKTE